jgi:hypothetical protein
MRKTFDNSLSTAYCELQLLILKGKILCLTFMKEDDEIVEQGKKTMGISSECLHIVEKVSLPVSTVERLNRRRRRKQKMA